MYREATNYAMEFDTGGKRTVKSLQTPNRATAEARAKLLMAQTRDRCWEILKPRLPGARLMKIEDLCALYRLYATTKERPLFPFTIGKNVCTFRRLAREMETDSVEAMVGKVKEWRATAMATKSPISIATDLRSAACVFLKLARKGSMSLLLPLRAGARDRGRRNRTNVKTRRLPSGRPSPRIPNCPRWT